MAELTTAIFGAIGGFITAFFAFKKDDKSNQLKHITEERKQWRVKIRELVVKFLDEDSINPTNAKLLLSIRTEIAINLNPEDDEDNHILDLMDDYIKEKSNDKRIKLSEAFAILLKHDWERVKKEAKSEKIITPLKVILFGFILCIIIPLIIEINKLFLTQCPFIKGESFDPICYLLSHIICAILIYMIIIALYNIIVYKFIEKKVNKKNCITDVLNINIRKRLKK